MQFDQKVLRALRYTVEEEEAYKFLYTAIPIFRGLFYNLSEQNVLDIQKQEDLLWIYNFSRKVVDDTYPIIKEMEYE